MNKYTPFSYRALSSHDTICKSHLTHLFLPRLSATLFFTRQALAFSYTSPLIFSSFIRSYASEIFQLQYALIPFSLIFFSLQYSLIFLLNFSHLHLLLIHLMHQHLIAMTTVFILIIYSHHFSMHHRRPM